jgi:carboxyl-terminal processing protease
MTLNTNYFAPEEKNVLMLALVVNWKVRVFKRKMTLPKYLNLFQEVRLEKQLEAGDLIMKVAQGNGLPVDVVGMRLDDVVKN